MTRLSFGAMALAIALIISPVAARADDPASAADRAAAYLTAGAQNPWTIMALSAAGKVADKDAAAASLAAAAGAAVGAIDLEAPIMAAAALGTDPRSLGGADRVAALENFYDGTQLGDPSLLNDDLFGLLSLAAAGAPTATDTAIENGLRAFVLTHQNADGGWGYATAATSDTNSTAAAIMALLATGSHASDAALASAAAYLKSAQDPSGGFPYDPASPYGTSTDASSDAWVAIALGAMGQDAAAARQDLLAFQNTGGYFGYQSSSTEPDSFTPVTTAYALIALLGKTLPIAIFQPAPAAASTQPPANVATAVFGGGGGGGGGGQTLVALMLPLIPPLNTLPRATEMAPEPQVLGAATTTGITASSSPAACNALFEHDLDFGMRGADVRALQVTLNHLLPESVARSGAGSPGHETEFFGPRTMAAIIRFQRAQAGLEQNGRADGPTRAVLNALCTP